MTEGFLPRSLSRGLLAYAVLWFWLRELWLESVNKFTEFSRRPYSTFLFA